jgi:NADH-quinone oxidoreductase subunit K/NAD(P)H-quinone oxidoreductase subunit 4L
MSVGLNVVLVASAALFAVGAFALIARRSAVVMLIGTQFMFAAGAIAFVAFARFGQAAPVDAGPAVAFFVGLTAAAELGIGAAMAVLLYRGSRNFFLDSDGG